MWCHSQEVSNPSCGLKRRILNNCARPNRRTVNVLCYYDKRTSFDICYIGHEMSELNRSIVIHYWYLLCKTGFVCTELFIMSLLISVILVWDMRCLNQTGVLSFNTDFCYMRHDMSILNCLHVITDICFTGYDMSVMNCL